MKTFEVNVRLHVAVKRLVFTHSSLMPDHCTKITKIQPFLTLIEGHHSNYESESTIALAWHVLHQSNYVQDSIVGGRTPGMAAQ